MIIYKKLRTDMVVYKKKKKVWPKWVLAAIVFISAMCITFNEISGSIQLF
jgi:hypothetical protein